MAEEIEEIRDILEKYLKVVYGQKISEIQITSCVPSNNEHNVNVTYKVEEEEIFPYKSAAFTVDLSAKKVVKFWEGRSW